MSQRPPPLDMYPFDALRFDVLRCVRLLFEHGIYLPTEAEPAALANKERKTCSVTRSNFREKMVTRLGDAMVDLLLWIHDKLLAEGKTDGPEKWKEYVELSCSADIRRRKREEKAATARLRSSE